MSEQDLDNNDHKPPGIFRKISDILPKPYLHFSAGKRLYAIVFGKSARA